MIKTIITALIFGALIAIWSLTNYNNDTAALIEVHPVETVELITPIKLPEIAVYAAPPKSLREQIRCMAHNIYHEAGGEPYMGQVAVARVVINRVRHGFAGNPCQVIYQSSKRYDSNSERDVIMCQFSWVCQRKISPDTTSDRYKIAEEIAELVLTEDKWNDEIPNDILFFHNQSVKPGWKYAKSFRIGNHTFYAKNTITEKK